jgi:hypothetical protein
MHVMCQMVVLRFWALAAACDENSAFLDRRVQGFRIDVGLNISPAQAWRAGSCEPPHKQNLRSTPHASEVWAENESIRDFYFLWALGSSVELLTERRRTGNFNFVSVP